MRLFLFLILSNAQLFPQHWWGGGKGEWRGSVFKLILPLNNLTGKLKSTSVNKCIIRFSSICKLHLMHGSSNPTRKTRGVLGSRHTPSRWREGMDRWGSWLFKRTSLQMLEIPSYSEGWKAVLHTQLPRRALVAENSGHVKKSTVN